jgi:GH25 family lysozyme M1 (1,4-beta-N-acetylmuramidase)
MDKVLGLDLNRYRIGVPLKQAKKQGARFIICKATEGLNWVDPAYKAYQEQSKKVGLPFGGYMYWRFNADAVKQAEFFLENLGAVQFPPIVDVERINNTKKGSKTKPIVSVQANVNHLKVVLNVIEEKSGVRPMIYTNYASWNYLFGNHPMIQDHPLWVANWRKSGEPYLPKPAKDWELHQFTANYRVDGYPRGLDANWFNGDEEKFEDFVDYYSDKGDVGEDDKVASFATVTIKKKGTSSISVLLPGDEVIIKVEKL